MSVTYYLYSNITTDFLTVKMESSIIWKKHKTEEKMETLIIGNTGYVTEKFIQDAFPEDSVIVLGNKRLKSKKSLKLTSYPFSIEDKNTEIILAGCACDKVVYFSNYLTLHGIREGELEQLRKILHSGAVRKETEFVYLTSLEGCFLEKTGKTTLVEAAEFLCQHYIKSQNIKIKTLRVPFLYSGKYEEDYLYQKIEEMVKKQEVCFEELPEHDAYFLGMTELAQLLYRIFDSWDETSETLNVPNTMHIKFGELADCMKKVDCLLRFVYSGTANSHTVPENDKILRHKYGWAQRISVLDELEELYQEYLEKNEIKTPNSIMDRLKIHKKLLKYVELVVGGIFIQLLINATESSPQFRMIDLRLLFIVTMGSMHGINVGLIAAAMASVSLVISYVLSGTNWMTLFYEPSNWIPFIAYFVVAAICGYIRLKHIDNIRFVKRENNILQDKFLFMKSLYLDTLKNKQYYKKQIVGSKDSFGKIFEVTRELDVVKPQELYVKTVQVIEKVLENQSVSVYSVGTNKSFGRLEVCSQNMKNTLPYSLRLDDYEQIAKEMKLGEAWVNRDLLEGYPTYATGVFENGELVLLIMLWSATYEQMSLYYENLVKILSGLVQSALLRALQYQKLSRAQNYIENTNVCKEAYFLELLKVRHDMLEQHLASYILLKLDSKNMGIEEVDAYLQASVRENDIVGLSQDGYIYVILSQMTEENVEIVINRIEKCGFKCEIVQQLGDENR